MGMNRLLIALIVTSLAACNLFHKKQNTPVPVPAPDPIPAPVPGPGPKPAYSAPSVMTDTTYTGSLYQGNYVWGGAMNLAWNELCDNIIHAPLGIISGSEAAQNTCRLFNKRVFSKSDLDSQSYYIKSGYGPKTVEIVNKECRKKFPDKTFDDLQLDLKERDILAYAYFLKKVNYPVEFHQEKSVTFGDSVVSGFSASNDAERSNVNVLYYENRDKFIISLKLEQEEDELILAKGFDMGSPVSAIETYKNNQQTFSFMRHEDEFTMPDLHLDMHREYSEMIGAQLKNAGFTDYEIGVMFENIKFDMDHKGARVENEGVIGIRATAMPNENLVKPRILKMDKPFWVMMKHKASDSPYFLLGINNTNLMKKP